MKSQSHLISSVLVLALAAAPIAATESPQFRGPSRDGIYPAAGLLDAWPEDGPTQIFVAEGLGDGYSSVTVAGGMIYTTGQDSERNGFVSAFDLKGQPAWKTPYGKIHEGSGFPGTRATPTYDEGTLYLISSEGNAFALDAKTGEVQWQVNMVEAYGARDITFGFVEAPLVLDDVVIFTPGAEKVTMVALAKKDGKQVWATNADDKASYCSPSLFDNGKFRQIVTLTAGKMIGVDPANGDLKWQTPYKGEYDIHAISPLFHGNTIIVSDGYGQGTKAFELAADGSGVTPKWSHKASDVHHGGAVLIDGIYYGAADKGTWYALDAETGEVKAEKNRLGKGAVIYADGRLYGYNEKGEILLVNPSDLSVISKAKVTAGEGRHWAHPVIANGVLYVRHGDALVAYDVKK